MAFILLSLTLSPCGGAMPIAEELRPVSTAAYRARAHKVIRMEFADKFAIAELIQDWGRYRDQGKWKELRGTFTPDGHISVSWFRGPFGHFVERCRASF